MSKNDTNTEQRNPGQHHQLRRNSASDVKARRVQGTPRTRERHPGVEEGMIINVPDEPPTVSMRPWANTTLCLNFSGSQIYKIDNLAPDLVHQLDSSGSAFYSSTMWNTAKYGNEWTNVSGTDSGSKVLRIHQPNLVVRVRNVKAWSVNKTPFSLRIFRIQTDPLDEEVVLFNDKAPSANNSKYALGYAMPLICRRTPIYSNSKTRAPQALFEVAGDDNNKYSVQINLEWKIYRSPSNSESDSDIELRTISDYSVVSSEEDLSVPSSIFDDPAVVSVSRSTSGPPGIPVPHVNPDELTRKLHNVLKADDELWDNEDQNINSNPPTPQLEEEDSLFVDPKFMQLVQSEKYKAESKILEEKINNSIKEEREKRKNKQQRRRAAMKEAGKQQKVEKETIQPLSNDPLRNIISVKPIDITSRFPRYDGKFSEHQDKNLASGKPEPKFKLPAIPRENKSPTK